ncbi:MAG: FAD-dependent oxidoreductase [Alkalibacterium sp.]|uniref:NADH:ubiquinone reductase (non-electrogenic) n=1 Tax=Alkalibacterium gilvum TaxID=1130080 RepID=A0A1H6V2P1_9LACT|nr:MULTISPECIES: FAD-dependent oxidoreductase [Alkalibacterium]MDN6293985.1 FAD-dependent oxidoreductase [Alkalibacterium sp.]MDN6295698.1 FAD-dependent oxidoreductase [Alkalibacterium sp.]MDN6326705.1 FAD-dependent oxidoreductase [Alkalibacterium sp.]MDN6397725.1 FAD-dependent oxidoreductase [Alkalibacterium sp.]MDN6729491.1 FAD-dependent oxidoreductase [Alkalibacterium sp.]
MTKKNIVVVGAGFAGVSATKKLAKKFKKNKDVTITLIDRHPYQTYMTELHEVAGGRVEPEAIQFDLQRLFSRKKNVKLVTDNVENIDHDNNIVSTENGSYSFDYLVLGMGGEPNDYGTPGVREHGFTLWSMEDAVKIREHIEETVAEAAFVRDDAKRKAMLTFAVCGSGFTGIEMIGELADWKERLAKDHRVDPDEISLIVVEAIPTILNMLSRKNADKAERYMEKRGIKILKSSPIVKVASDHIELKSGEIIPTHTLIWTAGVKANSDTEEFGIEKARADRLVVDEYMEAKGYDNVYVIGDLVYYIEEGGAPTPQIVQAAQQTGHTAANNIAADIEGTEKHKHESNYQGFMVSIGSTYGVAELLGKINLSGFFAILVKHLVNLLYFFEIRSGYYAVQYIFHEFFHIKDKRNIFRGHLSRYGNVLWSVPLRVFFGSMWLVEGLKKAFGIFGAETWFGDRVALPFSWLQDATSGASAAAETTTADSIFGLSYVYGEEPMMILKEAPGWFETIMEFMIPTPEIALIFQKVMTLVEIGIGLALIAGLFTWLVSAATIGLVMSFTLSGMFYWVNIWFVFVALALMNGAGRAFGLDYYVIPWIQKVAGNWWYGKTKPVHKRK